MRILYFDCFSGVSGDMILGAFLDLGLDFNYLKSQLRKLRLSGCRIATRKVKKLDFAATKFDVFLNTDKGGHKSNSLRQIKSILDKSSLDAKIKDLSCKIFENLADAECKAHRCKRDQFHFHEIGDVDSLIDVVGTVIALDYLKIDEIYSSAINVGSGIVKTSHGVLPVPAPAASMLLKGLPAETDL